MYYSRPTQTPFAHTSAHTHTMQPLQLRTLHTYTSQTHPVHVVSLTHPHHPPPRENPPRLYFNEQNPHLVGNKSCSYTSV
jgi:hypothetical protein